ncbi:ABC transporter ATP-binding protein [Gleimia hominis]|uniref:ABC transporter ATP-binding protein n=1 Tax=Gleimia hominis TaxID=595468 RepID=A0ABU3I922_9ACTO|nr:ABC transporter ATP-binding protein [Gleimia hominis]MDT3766875.1 ABC transporter ATP-binding protein [Gleimia hominis]
MVFIRKVLSCAWRISPWRNLILITAIFVSSGSAILAPYILGQGVTHLVSATTREEFAAIAGFVAVVYAIFWLLGAISIYAVYPLYGLVEQKLQSDVMARALFDSICANPAARSRLDNGEISFAIDTQAGAYRDVLSGLYLSVIPALLSLISGVIAVIVASSWVEGFILLSAIIAYLIISKPLIAGHQKAQSIFFKENMRSFGVLGNSLSLWKETIVFGVPEFLYSRYKSDRNSVEDAGKKSYRATRILYLSQALILAVTICILVFTITYKSQVDSASVIGAIISTVGISVASIGPLQSIGFGISSLTVAIAHENGTKDKIRPIAKPTESASADWQRKVDELKICITPDLNRPIWILGPSGSGKTTVLEEILGLSTTRQKIPTNASYVQQSPGLLNATAIENVVFGRDITDAEASKYLTALGLESFTTGGSNCLRDVAGEKGGVSGGERQRIAIARALVSDGAFIVLDEPTSGLDATARAQVWKLIETSASVNTVVVATHDGDAPIREDDLIFYPSAEENTE